MVHGGGCVGEALRFRWDSSEFDVESLSEGLSMGGSEMRLKRI